MNANPYYAEGQNLDEQDYKDVTITSFSAFIFTAGMCIAWMFGLI